MPPLRNPHTPEDIARITRRVVPCGGENEWVYMRTDENAWSSSEGRAHDAYATKADAVEALVDLLRHRGAR